MRSLVGDITFDRMDAGILSLSVARLFKLLRYVPGCIVLIESAPYNTIDAFFDTPDVDAKDPSSDTPSPRLLNTFTPFSFMVVGMRIRAPPETNRCSRLERRLPTNCINHLQNRCPLSPRVHHNTLAHVHTKQCTRGFKHLCVS
jgi:hypothetical protein